MGGGGKNKVKETAAEIAASQVALKEWNLYSTELKPFEDKFIQRVDNFNSDSNMAKVKEATDLSYNREYGKARDTASDSMLAAGVDPSSAKFAQSLSQLSSDQAIAQGDTVNRAQVNEQDKYVVGKQDVVAIGMGQKAEGLAGMEDTARLSQQKATQDAYGDFNRRSANAQAVGTLAGIGTSMYANRQSAPAPNTAFVNSNASTLKGHAGINQDWVLNRG